VHRGMPPTVDTVAMTTRGWPSPPLPIPPGNSPLLLLIAGLMLLLLVLLLLPSPLLLEASQGSRTAINVMVKQTT